MAVLEVARLRAMALSGELIEVAMVEAIRTLERALEREPNNALAMATAACYRAQCKYQMAIRKFIGWGANAP